MDPDPVEFLTPEQAVRAVSIDFGQYPPQTALFRRAAPLILGGSAVVRDDPAAGGVWIRPLCDSGFRFFGGAALEAFLVRTLQNMPPCVGDLARLCREVFWLPAVVAYSPADGRPGIRLHTGMDRFRCRRCGRCCRTLDYGGEGTADDVARWRALGRADILERVGEMPPSEDGEARYRLWVDPRTGRPADGCPWLERDGRGGGFTCRIHAVRPEICRQYPGSRKHAVMTGCPAFGEDTVARSAEARVPVPA